MVAPRTQPIFYQCRICKGRKGRGRNNGGKTCSAYECKEQYKRERALAADRTGTVTAAEDDAEDLPSDKSVVKLHEILGERCCQPSKLKNKQRRSALRRKSYHQEYLVRGSFLEDGSEDEAEGEGDEEDEEEDEAPYEPEENMYWVAQDILIAAIGGAQVKRAITARQRQVSRDLDAACSNSER